MQELFDPTRQQSLAVQTWRRSATGCLKLWRRFADPLWMERAHWLALHAADQVGAARACHRHGRHRLRTGDLGLLWHCLVGDDRFPTLDCF